MDFTQFIFLVAALFSVTLFGHWLLAGWWINQLKKESKRFESSWVAYLAELKDAVKNK